jgi:hypothetical protein
MPAAILTRNWPHSAKNAVASSTGVPLARIDTLNLRSAPSAAKSGVARVTSIPCITAMRAKERAELPVVNVAPRYHRDVGVTGDSPIGKGW